MIIGKLKGQAIPGINGIDLQNLQHEQRNCGIVRLRGWAGRPFPEM